MSKVMSEQLRYPWDNKRLDDSTAKRLLENRVLELTLPPHNYTRTQISHMINRSVSTVTRVQRELVMQGKLQVSETGHIIKAARPELLKTFADISKTDFLSIPSIAKWKARMERDNVSTIPFIIMNFWKVCQTLDVHPDVFLMDFDEILPLIEKFKIAFREGKVVYIKKKNIDDPLKQAQANPEHYIESIRSFIKRNGLEIPDGELKVRRKYNKLYAQIKIDDQERIQGIKYFSQFGNIFRILFTIHNEIGVRADTLFTMKPKFERITRTFEGIQCEWYKAFIWEKKQAKTGGYYEKYIFTPNAKKVVEKLLPGQLIHNFTNIKKAKDEYNQKLRDFYALMGKIDSDPSIQSQYEKGTQEYYLVNDPTHCIRKSCVHWLMRITGNRSEEVSTIFWEKEDTIKFYARQSFDDMLEDDMCALCNPDPLNKNIRRFCTLKHSIIYYNTDEQQREQLRIKKNWGSLNEA